jgi:serine protease Do
VNDQPIATGDDLPPALAQLTAGAAATLEISRGGARQMIDVTLGRRPTQQEEDEADFAPWSRSTGGTSERKFEFPDVLTHDGFLAPEQCGGPVVDLRGRLVGMNIARADRTATYALPVSVLRAVVGKASAAK